MSTTYHGGAAISRAFVAAAAEGRTALITYLTASYPNREATLPLVRALTRAAQISSSLACPSPILWPMARSSSAPAMQRCRPV